MSSKQPNNVESGDTSNNNAQSEKKFLNYPTFDAFAKTLLDQCKKTTISANQLPINDFGYLLSTNPKFKTTMKSLGSKVVDLIQRFLDKESQDAPSLKSLELAEGDKKIDRSFCFFRSGKRGIIAIVCSTSRLT